MTRIPVAFVEVERDYGGLEVYLEEPLQLSKRGQTMATAALYFYAQEHHTAHPRKQETITFSAGPDVVFIDTIDAEQADRCLQDLLTTIRLFGGFAAQEESELEQAA
jgi:hypothetical protein